MHIFNTIFRSMHIQRFVYRIVYTSIWLIIKIAYWYNSTHFSEYFVIESLCMNSIHQFKAEIYKEFAGTLLFNFIYESYTCVYQ